MKKQKIFTLYNYNKFRNDLEYIKEYTTAEAITNDFKLKNKKSVYNYIVKDAEQVPTNLLKNKYCLIVDYI